MPLTQEQRRQRDGRITASFLPSLMSGDQAAIISKWKEIVGDPAWTPENLEDSWPVQFGSYIESFALDWYERKTGKLLTQRGSVVTHPTRPFFSCTLDAYRACDATVIDCKAPGMWRKIDDVLLQYVSQMVGQRACVQASNAALLIVHGGSEPVEYPVTITDEYEREVWTRVDAFWQCCQTLTPPVEMPAVAAPVIPEVVYEMSHSNSWANEAAIWLTNREAKRLADAAEKNLKTLVPADAKRCHGFGVEISRNRAGSLSLKVKP